MGKPSVNKIRGLDRLITEVVQDVWKKNLIRKLKKVPLRNLLEFIKELERFDEAYADDNQRLLRAKKELLEPEKISSARILEVINEVADVAHSKLFCLKVVSIEKMDDFLSRFFG